MDRSESTVSAKQVINFGEIFNKIVAILNECSRVLTENQTRYYRTCTDHQLEFHRQIITLLEELRPQFDLLSQQNCGLGQQIEILFNHLAVRHPQPQQPQQQTQNSDVGVYYGDTYAKAEAYGGATSTSAAVREALSLENSPLVYENLISMPQEYNQQQKSAEVAGGEKVAAEVEQSISKAMSCIHANEIGSPPPSRSQPFKLTNVSFSFQIRRISP